MDSRRQVVQVAERRKNVEIEVMTGTSEMTEDGLGAEFEGLKVPASPFLSPKFASWIRKGNYERPERKLAEKLTRPGDRVVEMGAGIGFVGGYTAFKKPGLQLRSFEANPALIPHIEELYEINGLSDRARVDNKLLIANPDRPDHIKFHIHGSYLGSSVYEVGKPENPKYEIPTMGWDDLKAAFKPDVLVMDIEGAELDFLTHADVSGLRAIIVEMHPKIFGKEGEAACIEALRSKGMVQAHHRMQVYSFVPEGADFPR